MNSQNGVSCFPSVKLLAASLWDQMGGKVKYPRARLHDAPTSFSRLEIWFVQRSVMGDSEDDFDNRSRDKFRRERNDIQQQRPQQTRTDGNWQKYWYLSLTFESANWLASLSWFFLRECWGCFARVQIMAILAYVRNVSGIWSFAHALEHWFSAYMIMGRTIPKIILRWHAPVLEKLTRFFVIRRENHTSE